MPWIDCDIKAAIRERRKAERKWRANKSPEDFAAFKIRENYVAKLMNSVHSKYYSNFIRDNSTKQPNYLEQLSPYDLSLRLCRYPGWD